MGLAYQGMVYAAWEIPPAGAGSAGMGGITAVMTGAWGAAGNPAAIPWQKGIAAGFSIRNYYLTGDLNSGALIFAWNSRAGGIGLVAGYTGSPLLGQVNAGLSYGRKFGNRFSAGVRLDYYRIQTAGLSRSGNLASFEVGLLYQPDRHWILGLRILNPVPVRISEYPATYLPWEIRVGAGFRPDDNLLITAELTRRDQTPMLFRGGIEYHFARQFVLRAGASGLPFQVCLGTGFVWNRFRIDIAAGYHLQLGISPSISLTYGL